LKNLHAGTNEVTAGLTNVQKKVLEMVSFNGSDSLYVRDKAKKQKIEMPLGVINELIKLGFLERSRGESNTQILVRLR